jgi:hypothetical protein
MARGRREKRCVLRYTSPIHTPRKMAENESAMSGSSVWPRYGGSHAASTQMSFHVNSKISSGIILTGYRTPRRQSSVSAWNCACHRHSRNHSTLPGRTSLHDRKPRVDSGHPKYGTARNAHERTVKSQQGVEDKMSGKVVLTAPRLSSVTVVFALLTIGHVGRAQSLPTPQTPYNAYRVQFLDSADVRVSAQLLLRTGILAMAGGVRPDTRSASVADVQVTTADGTPLMATYDPQHSRWTVAVSVAQRIIFHMSST